MTQPWQEFGRFIKELRFKPESRMTQPELAKKVKKSPSAVSRWEKGDRRPKQATLLELASIFGVPIQVLQQKAGYTPEFDWYTSFLRPEQGREDILLTASDSEKEDLREYLSYLRFKSNVMKAGQPHTTKA